MDSNIVMQTVEGFTDELFFAFCKANERLRIERDSQGCIILMPSKETLTGFYNSELNGDLVIWNRQYKLGKIFDSSTGFTLPNNAVRSPDASWISHERWATVQEDLQEKFAPICPDFVVEVRSKTDTLKELREKMQEWINNGCRLGWLIDRTNQQVYIYREDGSISIVKSFDENLSGEDVLPNFTMSLTKFKLK